MASGRHCDEVDALTSRFVEQCIHDEAVTTFDNQCFAVRAEQRDILMEHARMGSAFSEAGHGNDIRLACHGLDTNDNDFVVGLLGPNLHPLSAMVQAMRKTVQTSRHLAHLGPFFIGYAEARLNPEAVNAP